MDKEVFTVTVRYNWYSSRGGTQELLQKPCICCGKTCHSAIGSYRDHDGYQRRVYDCPAISGTNPDPFYEKAGSSLYLGIALDPEVFAEIYDYDDEKVKEFFKQENKLIVHPIRVKSFRKLVLQKCDAIRKPLEFKREMPREYYSDDEMNTDDDTSSITSSEDQYMDC